jgi:hypothetical protein
MARVDDYLSLLGRLCDCIDSREFAGLEPLLHQLAADTTPHDTPSIVGPTVNRLRRSFSDLHGDIFHRKPMASERLIAAFRAEPFYGSPIPLMSGLALLTLVAATVQDGIDWSKRTAGTIPRDRLALCDSHVADHDAAGAADDAYSHTAKGLLNYARGDFTSAFADFKDAAGYFDIHRELSPHDHLMWSYRGICNVLPDDAITCHLAQSVTVLEPDGCLLAGETDPFVSCVATDIVYFTHFADNLARTFFRFNTRGALHVHVVLAAPQDLPRVLLWRRSLPPDTWSRVGLSWSARPRQRAGDDELSRKDLAVSYLTMARYFVADWLMRSYDRPLIIHDIDLTFLGAWDRAFDWFAGTGLTIAHHDAIGLLGTMPWFDKVAITMFVANSPAGRFYASCLAQVGLAHFRACTSIRYNIDQNLISSLTRYCATYLPEFRAGSYNHSIGEPWTDVRNDPAMAGVKEAANRIAAAGLLS